MIGPIDFSGCRRYIGSCTPIQTMSREIQKAFGYIECFFCCSSQNNNDSNDQEMIELRNAVYPLEDENRVFSRPPSPSSRIPRSSSFEEIDA